MDSQKYKDMADHDLLIHMVVQLDGVLTHLTKVNGKLEEYAKDLTRLKIIVACIIAGSGAGIGKILTVVLGG